MKAKLILLSLIIGLNYAQAQKSDFKIHYKLESKSEQSGDMESLTSDSAPESFEKDVIIHLQENGSFIESKKTGVNHFYDLTKEYIYTYSDDSLFDAVPLYNIIDYRIAEYENRTFLMEMLQAGGVGDALGDLANLESLFGIEHEKNHIRDSIVSTKKGDFTTYRFGTTELVRVQYSKTKIPKEFAEAFSKYLTYSMVIHPSIKEEILKTKLVPHFIQTTYSNVATSTTETYSLVESGKTKHVENTIFTKERSLYQTTSSEMGRIIDSMMFSTLFHKTPPFDSTAYFNEASKLSNAGENLSGLLCLFEYVLSTGHQPTNHLIEIVSKQESDSLLGLFIYCLNSPRSKEEAESKISSLNYLKSLDPEYGYVMNIFAANYVTPIDQNEGITYFHKALSQNPRITGAWLDLGKIYANSYNYDDAWKCFGIIMNIKADHPMANEIIDTKNALKNSYPKYFKNN